METLRNAIKREPLYIQIYRLFADRIFSGAWAEGQYLPSEYDLAQQLGVSEGTIRKALNQLAIGDLVVREHGRGTRVSDDRLLKLRNRLDRIRFGETHKLGTWNWQELSYSRSQPPEDVAVALELSDDDETHHVHRVRYALEGASVDEQVWLPVELVPEFHEYEMGRRHVAALAASNKVFPGTCKEAISHVTADDDVATRLHLTPGASLIRSTRLLRSGVGAPHGEGRPIEFRIAFVHLAEGHYYTTSH